MCLAIFKRAEAVIPAESLRNGWIGNPDGGGFAYAHKGKIRIVNGLMTLKEFNKAYSEAAKKHPAAPFLVHFRIRSMGDKNEANTHPFLLNNAALIHNGTIDGTGAVYQTGDSDTKLFVAKYKDILTVANIKKYRSDFDAALNYNKVAVLDGNGEFAIINENIGNWQNGVWYSNYTFRSYANSSIYDDDGELIRGQSMYDNAAFMG
jgi:predicted glutamine amidotransferase